MAPNEEKIILCVRYAALSVEGVASLSKAVRVSQNDKRVTADVFIVVEYGYRIPSVAWDIQERVKKELTESLGLGVKAINIYVQGVQIRTDEAGTITKLEKLLKK